MNEPTEQQTYPAWLVRARGLEIEKREATSHTERFITIVDPFWKRPSRIGRITRYERYFTSREEALAYVRKTLEGRICEARKQIDESESRLKTLDQEAL